ncbi:MFS transporter [Agromyces seonyuensis]|uniref:MFS transporter n=1 Tax=Agromyces seonyuensis TaxID=2662446 RepID=A0A6I4P528_9MICO|nr:MFS transporter [Agromyces seonyuensis]
MPPQLTEPEPDTAAVPVVPTPADAPAGDARPAPSGRAARLLRAVFGDLSNPVLRILVAATLVSRVGRGIFLAVTVLYFSLIVGLPAGEVAVILAASSFAGLIGGYLGGRLADSFSARRLLLIGSTLEGVGLLGYAFAHDFASALVVAVLVGAFGQATNTTRTTIVARAFDPEHRVKARAALRTVTNLSIAVGGGLAAIPLAVGTAGAYRALIVVAGLLYLVAIVRLVRLPRWVDASPAPAASPEADPAARPVADEADPASALPVDPAEPDLPADAAAPAPPAEASGARPRSPWRDPRYLLLTLCSAVFGMQFAVGELAVPLWISHDTDAPEVLVSALLLLNTALVVCFQVPMSRRTDDLRVAGRVSAIAAWLMVGACALYASAAGGGLWIAVVVILAGAIAHAFAEILSQAGGWGLSFELADPERPGAYQGVFSMGWSIGGMVAPFLITGTTGALGVPGWGILAAIFLASGLGTWAVARHAARTAGAAPARA